MWALEFIGFQIPVIARSSLLNLCRLKTLETRASWSSPHHTCIIYALNFTGLVNFTWNKLGSLWITILGDCYWNDRNAHKALVAQASDSGSQAVSLGKGEATAPVVASVPGLKKAFLWATYPLIKPWILCRGFLSHGILFSESQTARSTCFLCSWQ